jgi:hypothetical protein
MRSLNRLESVLVRIPVNNIAILAQEGNALAHELKGELTAAIKHRRKEIRMIERLHGSLRKSVESGRYDEDMAASILINWGLTALQERQAILRTLEEALPSKH